MTERRGGRKRLKNTEIWDKYEKGKNYLYKKSIIEDTSKNWDFYLGNQWRYLSRSSDDEMPQHNIIKGIVKYKCAVVSQNSMTAKFSSMNDDFNLSDKLDKVFDYNWERAKMDSKLWDIVKASCIQGDSYLFFPYDDITKPELISNTDVFFADEQERDIQKQEYIIIYERLPLSEIKERAEANGIVDVQFTGDSDTTTDEVNDKCACLIYLTKKNGIVHITRSTQNVVFEPERPIQAVRDGVPFGVGLRSYPLVSYIWERVPYSARGCSEVKYLIDNQISINRNLARRAISIKTSAFPKLVYNSDYLTNPKDLDMAGAIIGIKGGTTQALDSIVRYLQPQPLSPDAANYTNEMVNLTRTFAGAGDIATGQVNPERTSGAAIIAIKDQSEMPLNEQIATLKQFVEDLALVWFDIWIAYNPTNLHLIYYNGEERIQDDISTEQLEQLKLDVRIDVSKNSPWSQLAEQQQLDNMLNMKFISFEEYIDLSKSTPMFNKNKFKNMLNKRTESVKMDIAPIALKMEEEM